MMPDRVGRFEIVRPLGAGGMGVVYLGTDPLLNRQVAIKVLGKQDDDQRQRFSREARSIAALRHVNVVTIYDIGEYDNCPFIAMEYIDGEPLSDVIRRRASLTIRRRLEIVIALCAGLGHAHQAGIIHRDIKPANAIVATDGTVKILDFGVARLMGQGQTDLTSTGMILGTPHYMSPEQLRGELVDHRTDIYSVGVVLYELLSYRRPFAGDSIATVLHNILYTMPPPIRSMVPQADDQLQRIVDSAIQKDREARYASLASLAADLERVRLRLEAAEGAAVTVLAAGPDDETSTMPPRMAGGFAGVRRHRWRHATAATVAMVAAGAGWIMLSPSINPSAGVPPPPQPMAPAAAAPLPAPASADATSTDSAKPPETPKAPPAEKMVAVPPPPGGGLPLEVTRQLEAAARLHANGDYQAAIAAYESALLTDPKNAKAAAGLAETKKAQATEAAVLEGLRKKPGRPR